MNWVSWMILAADWAQSLEGIFFVIMLMSIIFVIIDFISIKCRENELSDILREKWHYYSSIKEKQQQNKFEKQETTEILKFTAPFIKATKLVKITLCLWCIGFFVMFITPEKETLYAIAASEMTEDIIKSDVAKETHKVIMDYLKSKIPGKRKRSG